MIPTNTYKLLLSVFNDRELNITPSNTYNIFRSIYDEEKKSLRINVEGLDDKIIDIIENKNYITEEEFNTLIENKNYLKIIIDDVINNKCLYSEYNMIFRTHLLTYTNRNYRKQTNILLIYQEEKTKNNKIYYTNYIGVDYELKYKMNHLRDLNLNSIIYYFNLYYNQDNDKIILELKNNLKRIY